MPTPTVVTSSVLDYQLAAVFHSDPQPIRLRTKSVSAKEENDDLEPETDALTDPNTQDSQADRSAARPSVSSTRGNR